jgi:hypothetical protein
MQPFRTKATLFKVPVQVSITMLGVDDSVNIEDSRFPKDLQVQYHCSYLVKISAQSHVRDGVR